MSESTTEVLKKINEVFDMAASSDIKTGNTFIENILDMEIKEPTQSLYNDLIVKLLEPKLIHQQLVNKSKIADHIMKIQRILMIYMSVMKFEMKKDKLEALIHFFNRDKNLNATHKSFVEEASFFLTLDFVEKLFVGQIPDQLHLANTVKLSKSEASLASLVSQSCQKTWLGEDLVSDAVHRTFQCEHWR